MPETPDYTVELFYRLEEFGRLYDHLSSKHFSKVEAAREFRNTALRTQNLWAPRGAVDIEVGDIKGPDVVHERPSREAIAAGQAMMRTALAETKGPLIKGMSNSVVRNVDRKRQAAGERMAS